MRDLSTPVARWLAEVKSALDHLAEAVAAYQQSDSGNGKTNSQANLNGIVRLPIEVTKYYESEERERSVKNKREKIRTGLEILGVIAAVVLAGLTFCTLKTLRGQLKTANQTNTDIERQFREQQRPWVGVFGEPTIESSVQVLGSMLAVDAKIVFKNYGPSPAIHAQVRPAWYFQHDINNAGDLSKQWNREADTLCESAADELKQMYRLPPIWDKHIPPFQFPPMGHVVFPNDTAEQKVKIETPDKPVALSSEFAMVGCIAYGDQFGKVIHYTRFCYASEGTAKNLSPSSKLSPCWFGQSAE